MTREYKEKPAAWVNKRADPEGHSECSQGRKGRAAEKPRDNRPRLCACRGHARLSLSSFLSGALCSPKNRWQCYNDRRRQTICAGDRSDSPRIRLRVGQRRVTALLWVQAFPKGSEQRENRRQGAEGCENSKEAGDKDWR